MKKTIILILVAVVVCVFTNNEDYVEIPASSIRIRVIAASDKVKDQNDKRIVKTALEEEIYKIIKNQKNYDDAEKSIIENKDYLDKYVNNIILENNINENVSTNYGYNYFPEKTFKGITYNAGLYKSYVVTLGNGEGENWWCVMYPPLCLIDENYNDYEYHSLIKDTIDKYN